MPLLGLVDGVRVVSSLLSADEFEVLKAAVRAKRRALTLPCGYPGHAKTSKLGTPYFASVLRTAPYWHPTRPEQSEWMYRQEEGGGYLNGMASHELDYLQTLTGRAVAVAADVRTVVAERPRPDGSVLQVDADDTSSLIMRMESGAVATVSTSVVGLHADSTRAILAAIIAMAGLGLPRAPR